MSVRGFPDMLLMGTSLARPQALPGSGEGRCPSRKGSACACWQLPFSDYTGCRRPQVRREIDGVCQTKPIFRCWKGYGWGKTAHDERFLDTNCCVSHKSA